MKQFIYLLAFACIALNATAQENTLAYQNSIVGLVATVKSSNLHITWQSTKGEGNYWEVQGSTDGKIFSTIGLVMGADPKGARGTFSFKQQTEKMKPGLSYFRVLHIETPGEGFASNPISLTK